MYGHLFLQIQVASLEYTSHLCLCTVDYQISFYLLMLHLLLEKRRRPLLSRKALLHRAARLQETQSYTEIKASVCCAVGIHRSCGNPKCLEDEHEQKTL